MGWFSSGKKDKNYKESLNNTLSHVELSKKIAQFAKAAAENSCIGDSMQFKYGIRNILNTKMDRAAGDKDVYIDILKKNILFFINVCKDLEEIMCSCFKMEQFPSGEVAMNKLQRTLEKNKITNLYSAKNNHLVKVYDDKYPIQSRIEQLEWDYMYYYAYKELMQTMYQLIIINPQVSAQLFKYPANQVVDEIKNYCDNYTNISIGNISIKPSI